MLWVDDRKRAREPFNHTKNTNLGEDTRTGVNVARMTSKLILFDCLKRILDDENM
jgi:hypothetical protein